ARGTETYTTGSSEGTKLANAIQNQLLQKIETIDRGVKVRGFYVIKHTDAPAVLVETAFIDNPADAKILIENEDDFARAIYEGILNYDGKTIPDVVDKPAEPPKTFDIEKIATLARKYESNGDPACVADNAGDFGGISYGLYQFASNVGVVDNFVTWLCKYPDPALANYGKVLAAHKVNSDEFIRQWKELGEIDPLNFGKLQDEYIKIKYYDSAAKKLSAKYFNVDKHTDALKAVILSRAVQNGASGCVKLFEIAAKKMGYPNLSYVDDEYFDEKIINAIYDYLIVECDLSEPDASGIWRSPDDFCHGARFNAETLEVKYKGKNIAEVLAMSVDEALSFFENVPALKRMLQVLHDVGLGYIELGQPANTLSGGESQRVKLAAQLARPITQQKNIYIMDEPTTGLHFDDVKKLIDVVQRLVERGDTVLIIEHNLDVIKCADYIIDLGSDGGDKGGQLVALGTPEEVAQVENSYTGQTLKKILN
ncbi:MAG: N-acetylmuramoyl-L-alanine amidase, partial [Selenomonadaceae bacterium]|nr:N-acetylmuramoyl-L-alanine amidase [Selenomonadaceae bacterium]